jgi:hypothetical protein
MQRCSVQGAALSALSSALAANHSLASRAQPLAAIRLDPNFSVAYANRGLLHAYRARGNNYRAVADYNARHG